MINDAWASVHATDLCTQRKKWYTLNKLSCVYMIQHKHMPHSQRAQHI